jgi:hypothetical protein
MISNRYRPWSKIINNHGLTSSSTMVTHRQKPWSTIINSYGNPQPRWIHVGQCWNHCPGIVDVVFRVSVRAEHSFLIRRIAFRNIRKRAPLISNSSIQDIRYFVIIRFRLTSNDGLPPLNTCGIAWVLRCLTDSSVVHHQPKLWGNPVLQFDEL